MEVWSALGFESSMACIRKKRDYAEVLTAVTVRNNMFCYKTPCSLVEVYCICGGICCLQCQCLLLFNLEDGSDTVFKRSRLPSIFFTLLLRFPENSASYDASACLITLIVWTYEGWRTPRYEICLHIKELKYYDYGVRNAHNLR
jgi:hypothetical protein